MQLEEEESEYDSDEMDFEEFANEFLGMQRNDEEDNEEGSEVVLEQGIVQLQTL